MAQEALAGVRVVRAYRQEAAELERFRRANYEYLLRNRRLIALQGFFFPSMSLLSRARRAAGRVARQPRGHPRTHHARASSSRSMRT